MTERELIIVRGLIASGYDNPFILSFINGETRENRLTTVDNKPSHPYNKDEWKRNMANACKALEGAKNADEVRRLRTMYDKQYSNSSVYQKVVQKVQGKFAKPSSSISTDYGWQ